MNANLLARMQMEHAMRQALGLQRMAVHYQPQVNMATGRITGAGRCCAGRTPSLARYLLGCSFRWRKNRATS